MSPDVLAMFNEAQKNIMELNRSRLKALEELKEAKQRISDLGTSVWTRVSETRGPDRGDRMSVPTPPRITPQRHSSTRRAANRGMHSDRWTRHSSDFGKAGGSQRKNHSPSLWQSLNSWSRWRQQHQNLLLPPHHPRSPRQASHPHQARALPLYMKPGGMMHLCTIMPTTRVCTRGGVFTCTLSPCTTNQHPTWWSIIITTNHHCHTSSSSRIIIITYHRHQSPGWTKVPGIQMQPGQGKWNEKKVLHLDANRVEFVATNGHDWDSPQPQNEGDRPNYWADVCVHRGGGGWMGLLCC